MKSSYTAAQTHCVWVYERDMLSTEGLVTDELSFAPDVNCVDLSSTIMSQMS